MTFYVNDRFIQNFYGEKLKMKQLFKLIWEEKRYIYNFARKWTSTFFAFGGIIALFVSFDDIFCAEWYHKLW